MKKIFIITFLIFFSMSAFAQYIPIPKEQQQQYKKEIEKIINTQVPISMKNIDNVFNKVETEKDEYEKELKAEYSINGIFYELYWLLIEATEKYVGENTITNTLNPDDNPWTIHYVLVPYFKNNKIKISKLNLLIKYGIKKQKELEKKYNNQFISD